MYFNKNLDDEELIKMNMDGITDSEIARHLGVPRSTVSRRRVSLGLPTRTRDRHVRVNPEQLDMQYTSPMERAYDEAFQKEHRMYRDRIAMVREMKIKLRGNLQTEDLNALFGPEPD